MDAGKTKLNTAGKVAIFTAVVLLVASVVAIGSIYSYKQYLRNQRYEFCLADDAFSQSWLNGDLTPAAENYNEQGGYTTYYFETGANLSYVIEYKDSNMVLIYNASSDHFRQYDGVELIFISIGEYNQGEHSFEMYPIVK